MRKALTHSDAPTEKVSPETAAPLRFTELYFGGLVHNLNVVIHWNSKEAEQAMSCWQQCNVQQLRSQTFPSGAGRAPKTESESKHSSGGQRHVCKSCFLSDQCVKKKAICQYCKVSYFLFISAAHVRTAQPNSPQRPKQTCLQVDE